MKRPLLLFLALQLFVLTSKAQDFDVQLEQLAEGLAKKIEGKGKAKIAVWGFFTENGEKTALGNYITEDFSVYLTNFGDKFEVIDRNHLDVLLKEHQLNAEGYIDENTAKELGKIVAVDVIITGTYTVLNSVIKVRAKALDTETALQFAASMGNLPLNENIASYLGVSINGGNTTNRGFNIPLSSKETFNNPETVNAKCSEENFGDICFYNTTNTKLVLRAKHFREDEGSKVNMTDIFLDPSETKCLYQIKNRTLSFYIVKWEVFQKELEGGLYKLHQDVTAKYLFDRGQLKVETCKSKTYSIK